MSVVSDSVRPLRRQPTRLPRPWDSPGKNTGVGSIFGESVPWTARRSNQSILKEISPGISLEGWVQFLGWEDPLEKEMATHSSVLVWRIPGMGEPGGLPSKGSHRVRHD